MKRNLLLLLLCNCLIGFAQSSTIVLTTTSASSTWSPTSVVNSGSTLRWSVSGGGVTIPEIIANDPELDLSSNTGTVTITITSDQGFVGLTQLDFLHNFPEGALIETIDVSAAEDLEVLNLRYNQLAEIDLDARMKRTRSLTPNRWRSSTGSKLPKPA